MKWVVSRIIGGELIRHFISACKIAINQSAGLIDVTQTDYNYLYCSWTIENVGITHAVALFLIQKLDLTYCR